MKYDFENFNKRFNSGSGKWNEAKSFGVKESDDIIPFSVADMEFSTAPEIIEGLKQKIETTILGYENPTPEYLETVCNWLKVRHNWNAKTEWILPSHGIVDAFFTAVKTYTNEGDGVMLMTPVYYPMYTAIKSTKRVLVDNKLIYNDGKYEIDFDDFERKAADKNTKMLILCSPHNPCGRVFTRQELSRIAEICLKNNVFVVSDEIHFDLIMPGHTHTVFASLSDDVADNCIVCTAPSKTFNLAGLQTSNIFIPNPEHREKFLNALKLSNPNPKCNLLGYFACEIAYKNCSQWLDEALNVINTNKNIIENFIRKEFPEIKITPLEGTYLMWLNCRGLSIGKNFKELERINHEEAKLFFDEGYIFGEQGEGFERWNIACPTRYINNALERMKKFWK